VNCERVDILQWHGVAVKAWVFWCGLGHYSIICAPCGPSLSCRDFGHWLNGFESKIFISSRSIISSVSRFLLKRFFNSRPRACRAVHSVSGCLSWSMEFCVANSAKRYHFRPWIGRRTHRESARVFANSESFGLVLLFRFLAGLRSMGL
jgi:hypothetical protein